MKISKILIILGEPQSIFSEILLKYFISKEFSRMKKKIILIGNINLFKNQMKKLKYNFNINKVNYLKEAKINKINILDVDYNYKKIFSKMSSNSRQYISNCFNISLKLIKDNKKIALINGPISKKHFLKKKYLGITEYLSKKTNTKSSAMLIYNSTFSVSPVTTHLPVNKISKNITKKKIINNILLLHNFYKNNLNRRPKIAVLGLNPHCETINKFSEEDKIISPAIKILVKKKIFVDGPYPADTFFNNKNIKKYNLVVGMYHDQVLTPMKTVFGFNAINITLGLPFTRISPDHGTNNVMIGKNRSSAESFFSLINFLNKFYGR